MHTGVSLVLTYRLPSLTPSLPPGFQLHVVLLSLLVAPAKFPFSRRRRRLVRTAKDISARSIPPRVIARYEFHVAFARKTTFARDEGRGRRRITGRGEKPVEGSPNSLLQPRGRQRKRERARLLWSKNVRHLRTAIAGEERRSPGNSKEIYGSPREFSPLRDVRSAMEK